MTSLAIDRRRLLTLTAAGVSVATLGRLRRAARAYAAETIRWVSPRGTIEVLDDYPYWVGKKFGYFGDIETTLEPGPSDATATREAGRPEPGRCRLSLARRLLARPGAGHSAGLGLRDGRRRRVRLRLPQGRGAGRHQGPRGQDHRARQRRLAVDRRSDAEGGGRRHHQGQIRRCRLADLGHGASCQGQGDAALSWEGLRAQWKGQGLDFDYILGRNFSKLPANSFVIRKADFDDAAKRERLRALLPGLGGRPRIRPPESARRDPDRHGAVPRPRLADDAGGRHRIDDAARQRLSRPLGRAQEVGLPHHGIAGSCSSTPAARSARSPATSRSRTW